MITGLFEDNNTHACENEKPLCKKQLKEFYKFNNFVDVRNISCQECWKIVTDEIKKRNAK